jgi:hypothetical protein
MLSGENFRKTLVFIALDALVLNPIEKFGFPKKKLPVQVASSLFEF